MMKILKYFIIVTILLAIVLANPQFIPSFKNTSTEYTIVKDDGTFETWSVTKTVDLSGWEDEITKLQQGKKEYEFYKNTYLQLETDACIQNAEVMYQNELEGFDLRIEHLNQKIAEYK